MVDLGAAYDLVRSGKHTEAEGMLRTALESDPGNYEAWKWLGICLLMEGRSQDALAALERAASGIQRDANLYYNLGVALQRLSRVDEARTAYSQALAANPDYTEAREALAAMGLAHGYEETAAPAEPDTVEPELRQRSSRQFSPVPLPPRYAQQVSWARAHLLPALSTGAIWLLLVGLAAGLPEGHAKNAVFERGPLPFISLLLFAALLEGMTRRYWAIQREKRRSQHSDLLRTLRNGPSDLNYALQRSAEAIVPQLSMIDNRLARCVNCAVVARSRDELYAAARELSHEDHASSESAYTMPRALIWALPVSGFIGTMLGMSQALGGFRQLLQVSEQKQFAEAMANPLTSLAVAFDTTLVALILTVIAMFLVAAVQRRERDLLSRIDADALGVVVERIELGRGEPYGWIDAAIMVELWEGLVKIEQRLAANITRVEELAGAERGSDKPPTSESD